MILFTIVSSNNGTVETYSVSSRCPIFITVVLVSELTGLLLATKVNLGLDSATWIVKFNASATACITSASDMLLKEVTDSGQRTKMSLVKTLIVLPSV